jgi:2-(1,2-epoxy-1,2-dihydrophenyl)acetyl-CoA isomerase
VTSRLPPEEYPLLEKRGPLATITFNRPHKFNAFHLEQIPILRNMLLDVEHDPEIRCLLFKGAGKHFMAGGDMSSVLSYEEMSSDQRSENGEVPPVAFTHVAKIMTRMQKPIVASVQGAVAGAAVGFICACDVVIAAENSFYWVAHVRHAGSNDGCVSYFLPRVVGHRKALEMALFGDRVYAREAKEIGLVNSVVPDDKLEEETQNVVERLCHGPTVAYGLIKRLYHASWKNSLEEQGMLEGDLYGNYAMPSRDAHEGLKAFFERREPEFTGK